MNGKDLYKAGVYLIENTITGRCYVGSAARSFQSRWQKHKSDLKLNKHANVRLQRAYNKYGSEAFRFEVLATCPPEYAVKLEQFFIDTLKPAYNISPTAGSSLGVVRSEDYKERLSKSRTGFKASDEFRQCRSEAMKGNTLGVGRKRSAETNAKIVAQQIGRKRSEETRRKIAAANSRRTLSAETRQKLAQSRQTFTYSIRNIGTGAVIETNNLKSFCAANGLHEGHMHATLVGSNGAGKRVRQHKGFQLFQKVQAL